MENKESLEKMNMGKLWSLARTRGIEFKGKKKKDLIKELIASDSSKNEKVEEVKKETKPVNKKTETKLVDATLKDGTKVKVPAEDVAPAKKVVKSGIVILKSVDGRELEASVGRDHWKGKEIEVPIEQEDEIRRLLTDGGFYFV